MFSRQKQSERDRDRVTEGDRHTQRDGDTENERQSKRDVFFACGLEILLSTAMKSSTYVNHAINET